MRRILIAVVVLAALGLVAAAFVAPAIVESQMNKVVAHEPFVVSDAARALHKSLNMADLHSDTLLWKRDVLTRGDRGHVDVPRLREGRFALQVFSTVTKTPRGLNYDRNTGDTDQITLLAQLQLWPFATWSSLLERALFQAEKLNRSANVAPKDFMVVRTQSDLDRLLSRRAAGEPIVGGILATEGAHPLEGKIENVKRLYVAGFRMIGLHHFFDNELGGSLHGVSHGGLTDFGREAVASIETQGMIVDLAHSSPAVVDEVLALATKPVIVSHTGVRGACESPRNLSDDQMRAIAAKGGLIGIGYWDGAVCDTTPAGIVKAIRYAIGLMGVDHVALGSDYDGATEVRFDASESAVLIDAMLAAGMSEAEIRKVSGENAIAFFRARFPEK
jgi:microsomal dipeptidase-like Zn-dependent dipeptidase